MYVCIYTDEEPGRAPEMQAPQYVIRSTLARPANRRARVLRTHTHYIYIGLQFIQRLSGRAAALPPAYSRCESTLVQYINARASLSARRFEWRITDRVPKLIRVRHVLTRRKSLSKPLRRHLMSNRFSLCIHSQGGEITRLGAR